MTREKSHARKGATKTNDSVSTDRDAIHEVPIEDVSLDTFKSLMGSSISLEQYHSFTMTADHYGGEVELVVGHYRIKATGKRGWDEIAAITCKIGKTERKISANRRKPD